MWQPVVCENVPNISERTLRWAAQLGIEALALPGRLADPEGLGYWTEDACRDVAARVEGAGLRVGIMMFNLSPQVVWGLPERDAGIDAMQRSITAAAAAGYPVVEYNFYNHRAVEGYGNRPGRGGCQYTDYDDARMRPLGPKEEMPPPERLTAEETWAHLEYLLRAVVPVADEVGVRLALHPNDPPPPHSRGAAQVLGSLEGMRRLVDLVPGTANGITLCQGSFSEWPGMDIVGAIREFGARDKIHHVHYRNPRGVFPAYVETWIDEGDTDMLRAMRAYREVGYRFTLCSDHVPQMTDDLDFGLIGRAYNHGYIRAMIQAANRTDSGRRRRVGASVAGTAMPWGRRGVLEWGGRLLVAGPALLAVACGAGTSSAPASPTSAPRNVTVSFAPGSWGTRAGRKEVTEGMLKEVGVKLPHIAVDLQLEAPSPTPNQTWITRVVSGDVPDLVISSGALFEWMARRNVWADMRPALQKIGWKQGDFFANPNTLSYAGKQHAVPFVAHQGGALVYNKTMFGEAGVPEPTKDWTWDDVLDAARRLTRPEKGQWGINGNFGHGTFFSAVWANNGEVLNRDHSKTLFAGPEGVEALELLAGLTTRHRVSPPPQQITAERLAFNSGGFAMEINTPGRQSDAGVGGKFEWDVTFFPRWPKTKKRVMIADFSEWAVTSGAAKRDVVEAATQLAAFYTNDFTQGLIADISPASTTPANKAVARSARYLAPPPRNMRVIVDMLDNKEGTDSRGWPYFEYFQQWQLPIRDLLPKVYNGEVAVKDGLQQAAEQGDKDAAAARA